MLISNIVFLQSQTMIPLLILLIINCNYVLGKTCVESLATSQPECMAELKQRFHDNGFDNREETTGQNFRDIHCCYYAQFLRCVENKVKKDCGEFVSSLIKTTERAIIDLANQCSGYTIESPVCIFTLWFNYIVIGTVFLLFVFLVCLLRRCLP